MRIIDPKFHIENEKIVKTSNGESIPDDEPLFLVRARDHLAVALLTFYRDLSLGDGCNDYHLQGLDERILAFSLFRKTQPERMKQPGVTRGL